MLKLPRLHIRLRLTLWYLLVFTIAQACFSVGAVVWMRRSLNAGAMDELHIQTNEIAEFLGHESVDVSREQFTSDLDREFGDEPEGQWLRVTTPVGSPVSVTAQAAAVDHQFHDKEQITLRTAHHRVRFLATDVTARDRHFLVVTGVTIDAATAAAERFRHGLLLLSPVLLLLAAAGSYWISRKALRPVDDLTSAARNITDSNLNQRLPVADTGDELSRLSVTLNEMLARIESSFQRVRQFTADASHELRTPVSLIRTEAEIALRRDRSPEEYREALQQISLEATRTGGLLENMLALARADSTQRQLAPVDCAAMLRELAHDWTAVMSDSGIQLTSSIPDGLLVSGDSSGLRRMFVILLDNARKYTPPGGSVTIRARLSAGPSRVTVDVEDTGLGIAPEHVPHIFDRFYRADPARNRAGGGVGLGLALAKRIAEQHNAELTVESTFGQGSRFTATLPGLDTHQTSEREREVPQA